MITCIVQARMGSERLKGKVIKNLMGRPMIEYTLKRLSKSKYIDKVVLATSDKDREDPLVKAVTDAGFDVFRGDEEDVLKRYIDCSEKFGGDIIIRITGDCPLIDSTIIDQVVTSFLINDYDYVRLDVPDTFVRGFDVEVVSREALLKVWDKVKDDSEGSKYREHVTFYIYNHQKEFKVGYVKGNEFWQKPYRLCVDTEEDFLLVDKIYNHFNDMFIEGKEVIKYLDNNPEVAAINCDIKQRV